MQRPSFCTLLRAVKPFYQRFHLATLLMEQPFNRAVIPEDNTITNANFVQRLNIGTLPVLRTRYVKAIHAASGWTMRINQAGAVPQIEAWTDHRPALPVRQSLYTCSHLALGVRWQL
jgi:hypothetical protein